MSYIEQSAPERLTMTAGKSVLEGRTAKDTKDALKELDQMRARLTTVGSNQLEAQTEPNC